MRAFETDREISVHAVAGTHVVLLGLNASDLARKGLLGFTIEKKTDGGTFVPLRGGARKFENHDMEPSEDSRTVPIQSMMWSDYAVEPGNRYSYKVIPVYGSPGALKPGTAIQVEVTTEKNDDGIHAVYFNRGVAGSQAYSRLFGKHLKYYPEEVRYRGQTRTVPKAFIKPEEVPKGKAYKWLSRGVEEGMLEFIAQARDDSWSLRAAVYEFTWGPVIQALVDALERGADVKVVHHHKMKGKFVLDHERGATNTTTWEDGSKPDILFKNRQGLRLSEPEPIAQAAVSAMAEMGVSERGHFDALVSMLIPRTKTSAISHNKFMVLLKDGEPQQVWTGSTNFTGSGIFGQSNVGHVVRDPAAAGQYHEYWKVLAGDPRRAAAIQATADLQPDLKDPPKPGITCVFSPRKTDAMLKWYAARMAEAQSSVFFTTAFTVDDSFLDVLSKKEPHTAEKPYLRYVLAEGDGGLLKDKIPEIQKNPQNQVAWGDVFKRRKGIDEKDQLIETLTGLNNHVNYVHTKYMMIDPLGDDPIVITGSANFSEASTTKNDENMLVIRGNKRVADIFVGEFMRLFNHFQSRNVRNDMTDEEYEVSKLLTADDTWTNAYFTPGTPEWNERLLFAGSGADL